MRRAARWLPLLALLAGCVDFVDPTGLRLRRDTAIELTFVLDDGVTPSGCEGGGPVPPDSVALCVTASVNPGSTVLGERLRVPDPTLTVLGEPLVPTLGADSVLRYGRLFLLPAEELERIPFTAVLPANEGQPRPPEIRWFAVGRAGARVVERAPGEGFVLRVDPPAGVSTPPPPGPTWTAQVTNGSASTIYTGNGTPRAVYEFPAEVLDALGAGTLGAELRWFRTLVSSSGGTRITVRFNEYLRWTAVAPDPPSNDAGVPVVNR